MTAGTLSTEDSSPRLWQRQTASALRDQRGIHSLLSLRSFGLTQTLQHLREVLNLNLGEVYWTWSGQACKENRVWYLIWFDWWLLWPWWYIYLEAEYPAHSSFCWCSLPYTGVVGISNEWWMIDRLRQTQTRIDSWIDRYIDISVYSGVDSQCQAW